MLQSPFERCKRLEPGGPFTVDLLLLCLRLLPCSKEHERPKDKHHQSPPQVDVDEKGPLIGGAIGEKSEQRQHSTKDEEQQAERKPKVHVHKSKCRMLTKDQIKNQGH